MQHANNDPRKLFTPDDVTDTIQTVTFAADTMPLGEGFVALIFVDNDDGHSLVNEVRPHLRLIPLIDGEVDTETRHDIRFDELVLLRTVLKDHLIDVQAFAEDALQNDNLKDLLFSVIGHLLTTKGHIAFSRDDSGRLEATFDFGQTRLYTLLEGWEKTLFSPLEEEQFA